MTLSATNAWALDLNSARDQGLVGETPQGYVGAVITPTDEVTSLINEINEKRKEKYTDIAGKNDTTLGAVEQLMGEKLINKAKPGHFVLIGGNWAQN